MGKVSPDIMGVASNEMPQSVGEEHGAEVDGDEGGDGAVPLEGETVWGVQDVRFEEGCEDFPLSCSVAVRPTVYEASIDEVK